MARLRRRFRAGCVAGLLGLLAGAAMAQKHPAPEAMQAAWQMEQSGTTAGLRGIHNAGSGVAWASGTEGTVLRTEDAGFEWQRCAMPPGAEKLDFRAVWGWDANTAVVLSSGTGALSRLYKTEDGCAHWTLLYTNPDKDGFWDGLSGSNDPKHLTILGDPVEGAFELIRSTDGGLHWTRVVSPSKPGLAADPAAMGAFAASNSSLVWAAQVLNSEDDGNFIYWFTSGGTAGPYLFQGQSVCDPKTYHKEPERCSVQWNVRRDPLPLTAGKATAGGFGLAVVDGDETLHYAVAVGGDYAKPGERAGTAAYWSAKSDRWTAAAVPPGGFRSAVDIMPDTGTVEERDHAVWITVGPNGSDVSVDNGMKWQPLEHPGAEVGKGGEWNALSLPWVVGPGGRIAKLNPGAVEALIENGPGR